MPTEILMPALSPTMEEGTLAKWLVREGDAVSSGDLLAEIETDKATMEFEAVDEGVIGKILIAEGTEAVAVNTPIATLLAEGESADAAPAAAAPAPAPAAVEAAAPAAGTIDLLMPALSPTMEEGTLAKWLVKPGDEISSGDLLAEIETDKATMEFEAVDEGALVEILIPEGTEGVKVNTPIARMSSDDAPVSAPSSAPAAAASEPAPTSAPAPAAAAPVRADGARIFASPLARRIAADKGLDLAQIKGSGPHGRIVKADVEHAEALPAAAPAATAAPVTAPKAAPAPSQGMSADAVMKIYGDREFEEVALDGMRKTIAARLTEAKQQIPHFYLRRDIHLDALLKFRGQINKQLEARGVKLSVNDFIIKACALALQSVPAANAVWAGDRMLKLKPSDVAVAVAIEGGLFTPVLRDADTKSLSALSAEMKDLAARARDRKLAPHEYQGGSFAISNLGMFGIENFDAVINPPHGSILAVGAGVKKPVVNAEGELGVATVMSVTLSVDHRVIDGALGAEFLSAIKDNLENPIGMLA